MFLTTSQIQFIKEHAADDLARLLLSAAKYPGMDIPFLVDQIAARRQIREKLPSWYENERLASPQRLRQNNVLPNKRLPISKNWLAKTGLSVT